MCISPHRARCRFEFVESVLPQHVSSTDYRTTSAGKTADRPRLNTRTMAGTEKRWSARLTTFLRGDVGVCDGDSVSRGGSRRHRSSGFVRLALLSGSDDDVILDHKVGQDGYAQHRQTGKQH